MAFTIFPTPISSLDKATWTLELPLPRQWSIIPPQPGEAANTISGVVIHSLWRPDVTGASPEYSQIITEDQYQKLDAMYRHATVRTWMIACDNRLFEANIEITSADRVSRLGIIKRDIRFKCRIIREVVIK